jgi:hypothetical protein
LTLPCAGLFARRDGDAQAHHQVIQSAQKPPKKDPNREISKADMASPTRPKLLLANVYSANNEKKPSYDLIVKRIGLIPVKVNRYKSLQSGNFLINLILFNKITIPIHRPETHVYR